MNNDNPYSVTTAILHDDQLKQSDAVANDLKFYTVAPLKFILLFVGTFGFYKYYWFYKNWSRYKANSNDDIWPVMRAIFPIFFVHTLFGRVDEAIKEQPHEHFWSPNALVASFVIFQLIINLTGRVPSGEYENIALGIQLILMVPVMGFILYLAQRAINVACGDPEGASNSKFSAVNWLWIVCGGIFLLMVIAGLLMK
jgi:hypothetical protein